MCAGLQYGLPGTWEGLRKRGASPKLLTKLWSTFPAELAGLAHRKGALIAGYDADIVVRCCAAPLSLQCGRSGCACWAWCVGCVQSCHGLGGRR